MTTSTPPRHLGVLDAEAALKAGTVTSVDLLNDVLGETERVNSSLGAYVHVASENALARAEQADKRRAAGEPLGLLDGIPVAVKDLLITDDMPTTACSRILEGFVAPYRGSVVSKLIEAGAVLVGKTSCDEFAMGSSNESSCFGTVKNPWDPTRIPGGSSGGSAAAVAADLCSAALGTDTGGSIRQPASMCGIVGLKPTYGRVSRYGVVAYASSLDQIGPMTKTCRDAARLLRVIAGHDPKDATSSTLPVPNYEADLDQPLRGLRLGVPKEYFVEGLDQDVAGATHKAIETLREAGAEIVDVSLPHTEYAIATYYLIATAEASSNLARYDGVRYGYRSADAGDLESMYVRSRWEGFGEEVKRRILLGTFVLSAGYYDAYYTKAQKVRTLIRRDFEAAFQKVDAIISPTSPTPAFRLGERTDDPLSMYLADIFTISCNLAGLPGLSVPCGLSSDGLPIGLQVLGKPFDEETVLRVGHQYEQLRGEFSRPAAWEVK